MTNEQLAEKIQSLEARVSLLEREGWSRFVVVPWLGASFWVRDAVSSRDVSHWTDLSDAQDEAARLNREILEDEEKLLLSAGTQGWDEQFSGCGDAPK